MASRYGVTVNDFGRRSPQQTYHPPAAARSRRLHPDQTVNALDLARYRQWLSPAGEHGAWTPLVRLRQTSHIELGPPKRRFCRSSTATAVFGRIYGTPEPTHYTVIDGVRAIHAEHSQAKLPTGLRATIYLLFDHLHPQSRSMKWPMTRAEAAAIVIGVIFLFLVNPALDLRFRSYHSSAFASSA